MNYPVSSVIIRLVALANKIVLWIDNFLILQLIKKQKYVEFAYLSHL